MTAAAGATRAPESSVRLGSRPRAGLGQAIRAEWIRLRSVRATWILLALLALVMPGLAAVVAVTGSVMPEDTVLGASIVGGGALALLLAGGLGATTVTSAHRTGAIAASYAGTPRRGRLLAAQAVVVGAVAALVAFPAALSSVFVGGALLERSGIELASGDPMPALLGVSLVVGCAAVCGVALGTILRQTGAALAAIGACVLLPGLLAPMFDTAGEWLAGLSFTGVLASLAQSSDAAGGTVGSWGPWPSLLLLWLGTCALLGVAAGAARRDL